MYEKSKKNQSIIPFPILKQFQVLTECIVRGQKPPEVQNIGISGLTKRTMSSKFFGLKRNVGE